MKRYQIALAFILLFLISGCAGTETRYISEPSARLQTWWVEPLDENVTYEVYDENG